MSEGGWGLTRNPYGNLSAPPSSAISGTSPSAAGKTVRSYGEFLGAAHAGWADGGDGARASRGQRASALTRRSIRPSPTTPASTSGSRSSRRFEQDGVAAAPEHRAAGQRPHRRHARVASSRPGPWWPTTTCALGRLVEAIAEEPLLEGIGDLRARGRRAERSRPRRRTPDAGARREPVRARGRWTARPTRPRHAADDRADPGVAANVPFDAAARRCTARSGHTGLDAVHLAAAASRLEAKNVAALWAGPPRCDMNSKGPTWRRRTNERDCLESVRRRPGRCRRPYAAPSRARLAAQGRRADDDDDDDD